MYLKKRLFGAMGNSTRAKPKTTKERQALKKAIKQTMSFSLGTRKAIGEVGIDKRTENTAEPLDYPVLERGHDGRSSTNVAVAQCSGEAGDCVVRR